MADKHFLDTSVVRPIISSSSMVKDYYKSALTGKLYYSSYVKMEFIRGFIVPSMNFHSIIQMPNILTVSDALSFWSNSFKPRELKAIFSLFSGLLSNHNIDFNSLKDKEHAAFLVADYIRRIIGQLPHKFIDIGTDTSLCSKILDIKEFDPKQIDDYFLNFVEHYSNRSSYEDCYLHLFLKKNNCKIQKIIENKTCSVKGSSDIGFKKIIETIEDASKLNCTYCSKIGDLIVSFICPDNMRLEHTDNSFDYIMLLLGKEHYKHPSEIEILKSE